MTAAFRVLGSVILWTLMVIGVGSATLWGLHAAGLVQPLVVVSGSMHPEIRTGDLILSTPRSASDLAVGDVVSVPSALTGSLVTHRIVERTEVDGTVELRLQGDANDVVDAEVYRLDLDDTAWVPQTVILRGGYVVVHLMRPAVAVPLVVGLLALSALSALPARHGRPRRPAPESRHIARTPGSQPHV